VSGRDGIEHELAKAPADVRERFRLLTIGTTVDVTV
jgi:hypothetical protein